MNEVVSDTVHILNCRFPSGGGRAYQYLYKGPPLPDLINNRILAVVFTGNALQLLDDRYLDHFKVVEVLNESSVPEYHGEMKYVIGICNTNEYADRMKVQAQMQMLEKKMASLATKTDKISRYERLAETNEDMKAVLEEYKSLQKL